MALKKIYGLGSRNPTTIVDIPQCTKCGKTLGMRPDWKEIESKKYCNHCAKDIVRK
ncbi:MAG: hypothetical protein KKB03_05010 [Nanoarchaeota archaeon]|nr:hypothetical protein [Nanoarchaeota archaeon]